MKLAAIVVTYYPDENLARNIKSYIDDVDLLMIWENTPSKYLQNSDNYPINEIINLYSGKIIYMGTGENVGLGRAYNEGVKYAQEHGFTHLMTMDQDSHFINFIGFKRKIEKETDKTVGMQVPTFNQNGVPDWDPACEVRLCIQSGCVFSLEMLDKIGLFREDFFTDRIDTEMGFRGKKHGYKCMCYSGCNMIHSIGGCRDAYLFGKFRFSPSDYSPIRRFYFTRNEFFLRKEYPNEYTRKDKLTFFKYESKAIIKIMLGETNKFSKIMAILKGVVYGKLLINKPY